MVNRLYDWPRSTHMGWGEQLWELRFATFLCILTVRREGEYLCWGACWGAVRSRKRPFKRRRQLSCRNSTPPPVALTVSGSQAGCVPPQKPSFPAAKHRNRIPAPLKRYHVFAMMCCLPATKTGARDPQRAQIRGGCAQFNEVVLAPISEFGIGDTTAWHVIPVPRHE